MVSCRLPRPYFAAGSPQRLPQLARDCRVGLARRAHDQEPVEDSPDEDGAEGDQLPDAEDHVPEVEPVDPEAAEDEAQDQRNGGILVARRIVQVVLVTPVRGTESRIDLSVST